MLEDQDPGALKTFVDLAMEDKLRGHWSDIDQLLTVFLSSERLTHTSMVLSTESLSSGGENGTLSREDAAKTRRVILGAQMACFLWSNPVLASFGTQHQPSPVVRHQFERVMSWIMLFFAHPYSLLLNEKILENAAYTLHKAAYQDQDHRDSLSNQRYAGLIHDVFSLWLSLLQTDTQSAESLLYTICDVVSQILCRNQDKSHMDFRKRDALTQGFAPYIESHADEVAKTIVNAHISRNRTDIAYPVLNSWVPLFRVTDTILSYPKTFHALLKHDFAAITASRARRLSLGTQFERDEMHAWAWWLISVCRTSAIILCGPSVAMQMLEGRLLPSLVRPTTRLA